MGFQQQRNLLLAHCILSHQWDLRAYKLLCARLVYDK